MIHIRSILFNLVFYANCAFWFLLAFVGYLVPKRYFVYFNKGWGFTSVWLFEKIIGSKLIIRGLENIPPGGFLVASKHQSAWETMGLLLYFTTPTFIFKHELTRVPLFGQHLLRGGNIPIERGGKAAAAARMMATARSAVEEGRQIIIFPEGTRRDIGAEPDYKIGVARLYKSLNAPVLPVALNTGLAWPRRRFTKYPYPVIVEFLEPIPAGMKPTEFFALLQERIETATARLIEEAKASAPAVESQRLSDSQANVGS